MAQIIKNVIVHLTQIETVLTKLSYLPLEDPFHHKLLKAYSEQTDYVLSKQKILKFILISYFLLSSII